MESLRSTIKEQLRKIEHQIDKITFLHTNPTQVKEVKKALNTLDNPQEVLRRCIARMDKLNLQINPMRHAMSSIPSIEEQLKYLYERRKTFDENKTYAFLVKNKADVMLSNKKAAFKSKGKTLSYEFKEKLTGFLTRRGCISWSDEKIDDFISSMMK
ncbi:hypothetical protein EHEL_060950 [Encephalitozoon hellem ATCC 50504]|uniref:Apoptosis-antagonizing transcription factor C-terminal domain-containing protein n=1 Tax=Encephalitozoon hellem TaxID=27973 RepID=A0A9Q9C3D0_ENCHE|nr:uncharacterized protein EHEL_060950 [Encephalitozoon hellem ATCC 50504]AFM98466.1 hypothetical protein EHEL_060950 [Encephalitozoon hellem ATCC 50504]UTX43391.1 hypothetical protein GPU96_06g11400 [Encephalitozoon hellem]|eukprot:XP_003887447.1 hypothetical protein EHEL_060950 [Encephalitozoon hellem ATCC 50504]